MLTLPDTLLVNDLPRVELKIFASPSESHAAARFERESADVKTRQRRSVNTEDGVFGDILPFRVWTGPLSDLNLSLFAGTCTSAALMPD